ncbi:type I glutamate--ammonia ligase [Chelatococcus sp. SYSU_G07232]|uniref:Glutamine synthetase n=1 Tax=Chelatococcus albus TaxID=3047466 RepID=A0ABT7AM08_9HYPH|nr:type I glutamate--ammonia ligase [Chelatococcus sp. SYSU_G07232]MDJ1160105.1 type I glutamate--ammonia ligase [Chelatococcus sp. SYSU_G07232]
MAYSCKTPADVLRVVADDQIEMIDLRFTDLPGLWQHFSVPPRALDAESFSAGIGFDGSSIRGFQEIQESDMLVVPDPETAFLDPFAEARTLVLICDIRDPVAASPYSRDVRYVARKAETYLAGTGIGDTAYLGPELEHFVFDGVRYDQGTNYGFYEIAAREANWDARQSEGNGPGHKLRAKEGYFPTPPADALSDARASMARILEEIGIAVEAHHHEVAAGGQGEIDMRFTTLTRMADNVMIYKHVVKNEARRRGMTATFMPKPLFGDNGSGMHVHQSLWQDGRPLFAGDGYAGSSELMRHYIGGLLVHAPALLAICAPTVNSYRRLVPGFEAPVNLGYSQRNRSAACRIPVYSPDPRAKRVEFRCPDPACNPYLAFAAMLMAGLDGIRRRLDPGEPIDENLYELSPEKRAAIPSTPASLEAALDALEADHAFLLEGGVFTPDVIETYLAYKRAREIDEIRLRPHPYEFVLYYDV